MTTTTIACADHAPVAIEGVLPIEGLCRNPDQIAALGDTQDRVVMLLHPGEYDLAAVQKALRSIDVDPLGAQLFEIADDPLADIPLAVAGLEARASAFTSGSPAYAKAVLPQAVTRRGFLRPPAPVFIGAPSVDHTVCAAGIGCSACVEICPKDAYEWRQGRIFYDKDVCEPCGQCITRCPTNAIANPAATPRMIEAQVRALLDAAGDRLGIRFVCSRGSVEPQAGWADVVVPCSSMVRASWLLAAVLLGAASVYAVPCGDSGCPLGYDAATIQANDAAQAVLGEFDIGGPVVAASGLGAPMVPASIQDAFGIGRAAHVVMALADAAGTDVAVSHPDADLGVVTIDPGACTLCGQCAKACPTGALLETYQGDEVAISFDPGRCVNCTQCVASCPELKQGAISVGGRYDTVMLAGGRATLNSGTIATCEVCGKPIAPTSMMNRIGDLLGDEFASTMESLGRRCLDCRGR